MNSRLINRSSSRSSSIFSMTHRFTPMAASLGRCAFFHSFGKLSSSSSTSAAAAVSKTANSSGCIRDRPGGILQHQLLLMRNQFFSHKQQQHQTLAAVAALAVAAQRSFSSHAASDAAACTAAQQQPMPVTNTTGRTGSAGSNSGTPTDVYHAGLRYTEFTHECRLSSESQVIPIFRVLGYDGKVQGGWTPPFTREECVEKYKFMVRLNIWDNLLYNIQRQGRISFYMQNQGEEALQTAIGTALGKGDHLWCQYRELGILMCRGFTIADALNQLFSTEHDPGKGRQMPISYTKREIGLQTICTPLATQVPHAAGCGYAFKLNGERSAAVAFFGDGSASEGDVHAGMNFAAVLKSQTMFVCRNNGYAISTPVRDQYAGDGIAIRGLAYGIDTMRVDGNDLFASYIAAKQAWELCVNESKPVCIEFMTYRMGHHSTSDDSAQYRPDYEMSLWTRPGINGIARLRLYLEANKLWDEARDQQLVKEAKQTMLAEIKAAELRKCYPVVPGVFEDTYDVNPWHLKEQEEHLREHLKRHPDAYDVSRFRAEEEE